MKKIYMMMAASLVCAGVSAGNVDVKFDGTDSEGWKSTTADATAEIANGHLSVQMALQSNGKYRGDLRYDAPGEGDVLTLNPETDKILAVKFIGSRPSGNLSLEFRFQDNVTCSGGNFNNKPHGSTTTSAGNQVYYYELSRNANYGTQTTNDLKFLTFKVADATQEPFEYVIDWIKAYPSVEAMEADKNRADDGQGDVDEAVVVDMPVVNVTTNTGYTALAEAWDQAKSGDVIEINEDQTVGSRLNAVGRNITLQGNGDVKICRGEKYTNGLMFLTNNGDVVVDGETVKQNGVITLRNLTIDGVNVAATSSTVEASGNGTLNMEDVVLANCVTTHNQGLVSMKNGGKVNITNVTMSNVTIAEGRGAFFCGTNNLMIKGNTNVSVFCEKALTCKAADLAAGAVVELYCDASRDMAEAALIVAGEGLDVANFHSNMNDYNIKATEAGIEFVYEPGYSSAVEAVVVESENAPVEYYNLQGVRCLLYTSDAADEL